MDHKYISDLDVVERYLLGRLAAEEIADFEDHFVDCTDCLEQLQTTKSFIEGLRIVATTQVIETHQPRSRSFASWFRSISFRRSFALVASLLILGLLFASFVLSNEARRWRNEAENAKNAAIELDRRDQETERDLTNKLDQLQADIEKEKDNQNAHSFSTLSQPAINLPILALESTRGTDSASTLKNQVNLRSSDEIFVLSLALEAEQSKSGYRITVRGIDNKPIWKRSGLRPDRYHSLTVVFPSTFFRSGNYQVTVEKGDGSEHQIVGEYSFRVVKV